MNYAPIWKNPLPSITGQDALKLGKYIDISYWRKIKKLYEEFLESALASKEVMLLAVIGEWGVGKTASYKAFLEPMVSSRGGLSVIIKASDVVNFFIKLGSLSLFSAERTLRALLLAVAKKLGIKRVRRMNTANILRTLLKSTKKSFLVLFLDEFESLLGMKSRMIFTFIDGLVGLVNGEFEPLSKEGELSGKFHVVLSLTPQARAKLMSDSSLVETIGRHLRRMRAIELRPFTRDETYEFLVGCFRYLYDGRIPARLPIPTISIFDAYYLATRGYPGYLVAVLNNLLSGLLTRRKGDEVPVAESDEIISSLKGIMIEEIGDLRIDLISEGSLNFYKNLITEDLSAREKGIVERVFKALAILACPVTLKEISSLSRVPIELCKASINIIEEKLSAVVQSPILRFKRAKLEKVLSKLRRSLERLYDETKDLILEIMNTLTKFVLENGELIKQVMIPADEETKRALRQHLQALFPSNRLLIERALDELARCESVDDTLLYALNFRIISDLYPPLCPICSLIEEKNLALSIWRDTLRKVTSGDYDYLELGKAILPLFMEEFLFNEADYLIDNYVVKKVWRFGTTDLPLRFVPAAVLVKKDLLTIVRDLGEKGVLARTPIILLFVKEDLFEYIQREIDNTDLNNLVILIPLHTIDIAIMYGIRRILHERGLNVNREAALEIVERVRRRYDFDIRKLFEDRIIREGFKKGIIVTQPSWSKSPSLSALPSVYDYYLVFPKQIMHTEEVFRWVTNNVKSKQFFGWKRRDVPCGADIESVSKLQELENYLVEADFLERVGENVRVKNTSIENMILRLLSSGPKSLQYIKEFFLIERGSESLLETIYIPVLERKGLIRRVRKESTVYLQRLSINELLESLDKRLEGLRKSIENKDPVWKTFTILMVAKERDYRIIILDELFELIDNLRRTAIIMKDELNRARLLNAAWRILGTAEEYVELITLAYRFSRDLLDKASSKVIQFEELLKRTLRSLKSMGIRIIKPFKDIEELESLLNKLRTVLQRSIIKHEIESFVIQYCEKKNISIKDMFDFRNYKLNDLEALEESYFFNPKYVLVKEIYEEIINVINKKEDIRREIHQIIYHLPSRISKFKRDIETRARNFLKNLGKLPPSFAMYVSAPQLSGQVDSLEKAVEAVRAIKQAAENVMNKLQRIKDSLVYFEKISSKISEWGRFVKSAGREANNGNISEEDFVALRNIYDEIFYTINQFAELLHNNPDLDSIDTYFSENSKRIRGLVDSFLVLMSKLKKEIEDRKKKCRSYVHQIEELLQRIPINELRPEDRRVYEEILGRFGEIKVLVINDKNLIEAEKMLRTSLDRLNKLLENYADQVTIGIIRILTKERKGEISLESLAMQIFGDGYTEEDLLRIVKRLLKLREKFGLSIIIKRV